VHLVQPKSIAFKCFLNIAAQTVVHDVGSRFQACSLATDNALELTDNETCRILYYPLSAERKCHFPGSVENSTTAC